MLTIGQKIPDFSIEACCLTNVKTVNQSDFNGKWLVVVFYPADFTFVCPTELEEFSVKYDEFTSLGAEILSISQDSISDHKKWQKSALEIAKIKYPMGADPSGSVYRSFGIYAEDRSSSVRATFIFDPSGILMEMNIHDNRVGRNVSEILRKLTALKYVSEHPDELCPENWNPGKQTINVKTGLKNISRIPTGIVGLDKLLAGGLEEKNVYLVAGESGSGKTVLSLQFIYAGLTRGDNAIYVAVHESPREIIDDAASFGWDIRDYLKNKNLTILDLSPYVSKVNEGETLSVGQMMADLAKQVRQNNAKLIVLDSIDFIARHVTKSDRDIGEYIREIILAIGHDLGCTTILTSHILPGDRNLSLSGVEEHMVTGVIILGVDKSGTHRLMKIKKMRQTHVGLLQYSYHIDPKKGIVITGEDS
ncbi:redoxin domain-containing protein [Candidatus Micrarchaeota archaeon]|nr:redoxin domain-containing protein [Candidatus Micrarchaeota archaeon]